MARIDKTGVYRHKDGTAVYLVEGQSYPDDVMKSLEYDGGATKERTEAREPDRFGFVTNAPQDQKPEDTWSSGRMVRGAPENKAMGGAAEQKSDAQLADDAAKKGK